MPVATRRQLLEAAGLDGPYRARIHAQLRLIGAFDVLLGEPTAQPRFGDGHVFAREERQVYQLVLAAVFFQQLFRLPQVTLGLSHVAAGVAIDVRRVAGHRKQLVAGAQRLVLERSRSACGEQRGGAQRDRQPAL